MPAGCPASERRMLMHYGPAMDDETLFAGVAGQAALVRDGELSARELTAACLNRIDVLDHRLNAFTNVMRDQALAVIRERQGRIADAIALRQKVAALRTPTAADLVRLGQLAMQAQRTALAIESFEGARTLSGATFANDLELGVLYLAARRYADARDALDRIPSSHAEYPMVLFKRAQVSVLLKEPDSAARIGRARARADPTTRELIEKERLFQ